MTRRGLSLLLFLGGWACASDVASTRSPILGGEDTLGRHPGVVRLIRASAGTETECTGTLVFADAASGRGLVLTAAHCIFEPAKDVAFTGYLPRVELGPDLSTSLTATRVALHARYGLDRRDNPVDPWPVTPAYDFAVVEVMGIDATIAGWVIAPLRADEPGLAPGERVTLVGVGAPTFGTRNEAEATLAPSTTLERTGQALLQVDYGAGTGACSGDSGGPMLADLAGSPRVVGVFSSFFGGCSARGDGRWGDVRDADALIRALESGLPPPRAETCAACAGTSGSCPATRAALLGSDVGALEACLLEDDWLTCSATASSSALEAIDTHWRCLLSACADCDEGDRLWRRSGYALDGAACDACIAEQCFDVVADCRADALCARCTDVVVLDAECRSDPRVAGHYQCLSDECGAACDTFVRPYADMLVGPDAATGVDASSRDSDGGSRDVGVAPADAGPATPPTAGCACAAHGHSTNAWLSHIAAVGMFLSVAKRARRSRRTIQTKSGPHS